MRWNKKVYGACVILRGMRGNKKDYGACVGTRRSNVFPSFVEIRWNTLISVQRYVASICTIVASNLSMSRKFNLYHSGFKFVNVRCLLLSPPSRALMCSVAFCRLLSPSVAFYPFNVAWLFKNTTWHALEQKRLRGMR